MYKNLGMLPEHTLAPSGLLPPPRQVPLPPVTSPALPSLDLFRFSFDLHPGGSVVQAKHPCMLSGESDPAALGYASAALETALDCQAALKKIIIIIH